MKKEERLRLRILQRKNIPVSFSMMAYIIFTNISSSLETFRKMSQKDFWHTKKNMQTELMSFIMMRL